MFKNMTIKKKRAIVIFELVSVALVIAICGFYAIRLYRSYKDMMQKMQDAANLAELRLYQVLESGVDKTCSNNGLVFVPGNNSKKADYDTDSGDYYYWCGQVDNNYVLYSGHLYRMLDINSNGEIRAICEDVITESIFEKKTYIESSLFEFLNATDTEHSGIYYNTLKFASRLVVSHDFSYSLLDQKGQIVTENHVSTNAKVALLSRADYLKFGGNKSFINNGTTFWIMDETDTLGHFLIDSKGNISCSDSPIMLSGVRPLITFSFDTYANSGDGTKSDPYVIRTGSSEEKEAQLVSDLQSGQFVSYGDILWRVDHLDENGNAVLMMCDVVKNSDNEPIQKKYSDFKTYLNKTLLKALPQYTEMLVKYDWNTGRYNDFNTQEFLYLDNYETTEQAYVGMINSTYLYMLEYRDCFLSTGFQTSNDLVAYINADGFIASDFASDSEAGAHSAAATICVRADVALVSGTGTVTEPFTIIEEKEAE